MANKKTIEMNTEEFQERFEKLGEKLKEQKEIQQKFETDGLIKSEDEMKDSIL